MCDICFSIYGHEDDCPENFNHLTDVSCNSCGKIIENGEGVVKFSNGELFCRDCIDELSPYELCVLCEVNDVFELIERFGISTVQKL